MKNPLDLLRKQVPRPTEARLRAPVTGGPSFRALNERGLRVRIQAGQISCGTIHQDIQTLRAIRHDRDAPGMIERGLTAAGGAAIGMLFSPIGAAIGAAAGAAAAKGKERLVVEITTTQDVQMQIIIRPEQSHALELAACTAILR